MTETLTSQPAPAPAVPQLARGIDLFGEYEGSGFKEPPYLARRADGQVIQLTRLIYLVAAQVDGQRSLEQIAARVSIEFGRVVSVDNVRFLVETKLRPLGVIADDDGSVPENLERANPMTGLRFRVGLIPESAVRAISAVFWPLFLAPVVIAVIGALIAVDVWLFFQHGLIESVEQILYQPSLIFVLFLLETVSAAFHEFGHASASRYGGARTGVIGVGIYVFFVVFYSDATDSYRLGKADRLRVDLGGVYFDAIFSLAMAGAYFLTGFEPLLVLVLFNQLGALDEFSPFLRFDGYYVISDLIGVPDLFGRIKPIMLSLIPGRPASERVTELKPWARAVVTVWVLLAVPLLMVGLVLLIIFGPELITRWWRSLLMQSGMISRAYETGSITDLVAGLIEIGVLIGPAIGTAFILGLLVLALGRILFVRYRGALSAAQRGSDQVGSEGRRPLLRAGLVAPVAAAAAAGLMLLFFWLPVGGGFEPTQRIDRATASRQDDGTLSVPEIAADRPAQSSEESASKAPPEGSGKAATTDDGDDVETANPSRADTADTGQDTTSNDAATSADDSPSTSAPAPEEPAPAPEEPAPAPSSSPAPAPSSSPAPAPSSSPAPAPSSSPAPAPSAPSSEPAPAPAPAPAPVPAAPAPVPELPQTPSGGDVVPAGGAVPPAAGR